MMSVEASPATEKDSAENSETTQYESFESIYERASTGHHTVVTGSISLMLMLFMLTGLLMVTTEYNESTVTNKFSFPSTYEHRSRRQPTLQSFAVLSDIDDSMYPRMAGRVDQLNPNYLVMAGDIDYTGEDPPYVQGVGTSFPHYAEDRRIVSAFGNHDFDAGIDYYSVFFGIMPGTTLDGITQIESKYYYTRIIGEVQWFILCSHGYYCGDDGKGMEEGGQQARWLDRVLAESRANTKIKFRFVINHWSPLNTLAYCCEGDCEHRLHWYPFAANGVDALFTGHDHAYQRLSIPTTSTGSRPMSVNGNDFTVDGWQGLALLVTGTGKSYPGRADRSCSAHEGFDAYNRYDANDDAQGVLMGTVNQYADGVAINFFYMALDGRVLDMFSVHNTGHLENTWHHGQPVQLSGP